MARTTALLALRTERTIIYRLSEAAGPRLACRTAQLWAVPVAASLCMNSLGVVRRNLGESCVRWQRCSRLLGIRGRRGQVPKLRVAYRNPTGLRTGLMLQRMAEN
jgi:hypothetical protein